MTQVTGSLPLLRLCQQLGPKRKSPSLWGSLSVTQDQVFRTWQKDGISRICWGLGHLFILPLSVLGSGA